MFPPEASGSFLGSQVELWAGPEPITVARQTDMPIGETWVHQVPLALGGELSFPNPAEHKWEVVVFLQEN